MNKIDGLIQTMQEKGFLTSNKVEKAILSTPRHFFVPEEHEHEAYEDRPIETKKGQTISQPSVVAHMTELLDIKPGLKILEIGTGSGWQSAIIAKIVEPETVFTVEKNKELVEFAKTNHTKANVKNVKIIHADGTLGLPDEAPFDRIIITAACKMIPDNIVNQLSEKGILVAPIGKNTQKMYVYQKINHKIIEKHIEDGYVFVPLVGIKNKD